MYLLMVKFLCFRGVASKYHCIVITLIYIETLYYARHCTKLPLGLLYQIINFSKSVAFAPVGSSLLPAR